MVGEGKQFGYDHAAMTVAGYDMGIKAAVANVMVMVSAMYLATAIMGEGRCRSINATPPN